MSIQERLVQLGQAKRAEEVRQAVRKEEEQAGKNARYWGDLESVQERRAVLLEELRKLGVVQMIEEFIGHKILPMQSLGIDRPTDEEIYRRFQELHNKMLGLGESKLNRREREWDADVLLPAMSETGAPDPTLVIVLQKLSNDIKNWRGPVARVLISFGTDRQLEIKGREVTFKGAVPQEESGHNERLEAVLAQAIDDPMPIP